VSKGAKNCPPIAT